MTTGRQIVLEAIYDYVAKYVPDFSWDKDVNQLNYGQLTTLHEIADAVGYKKPANHSKGYGFYMYMQKVADSHGWMTSVEMDKKERESRVF